MCFTARVKILSTDVVSHLQVLLCDWNLPYLSTINEMSQVSVADVVVHYLKILGYLRSQMTVLGELLKCVFHFSDDPGT